MAGDDGRVCTGWGRGEDARRGWGLVFGLARATSMGGQAQGTRSRRNQNSSSWQELSQRSRDTKTVTSSRCGSLRSSSPH